uniref:Uncharacterized protein n=1 Tax=Oryza brachyantha TaxID=4533 RepID=J3MJG2_ORYBR
DDVHSHSAGLVRSAAMVLGFDLIDSYAACNIVSLCLLRFVLVWCALFQTCIF